MKTLDANWLTNGLIDFEYKKYTLLAYLQAIKQEFDALRLYPFLSDLFFHYQNLQQIKENKRLMYEQFPQRISQADFKKLEILYHKIVQDDETMRELAEIVQYALPRFDTALSTGKEIYEAIESQVEIAPVGLTPIYYDEGYLFLDEFMITDTKIYQYQISVFESAHERFRGLNIRYLDSFRKGIGQTYENAKISLIKRFQNLPNPATFVIISKVACPLDESLLPIAKRILIRYLSTLKVA